MKKNAFDYDGSTMGTGRMLAVKGLGLGVIAKNKSLSTDTRIFLLLSNYVQGVDAIWASICMSCYNW